ncbi:MAG: SurA N-terminal domain-containing protein, partial [Acidobacteriota bacterium]|nr:SurA N-terminal domain-containing protein [Acidobacteriota bacterium]
MRRAFKVAAVVAFVAALPFILSACGGGKAQSKPDVAATVNGKEITLTEVDRLIKQQTQGQQLPTLQLAAARLQALDNLIQREAVYLRAEKEKTVPTDDEVTTAINNQKSQMTAEEWQKFLSDNEVKEEQLRDEARKDLAISNLQKKLFGNIQIREQEITDFYNNNREQFKNPRGVTLSSIIVDPRDNTPDNLRSGEGSQDDAKSDAEATAKINRLYAQLKAGGADFATVAHASSEDQSYANGGDLGFFDENKLRQAGFPQDLIAKFGTMKVGDITEPIHFPDGRWGIFKLTNRQTENKQLSLDDPTVHDQIHDQIKQALINQRQTILNEALIRNAMSDATIVNKLAEDMLKDPNMLGGLQPLAPGASPASSPAASASPTASAPASATPSATTAPSSA